MKRSILKEFVVLSPDKKATTEKYDSMLYNRLESDYDGFTGHELISCYEFDEDWSSWEIHPNGDETVILLSGQVSVILQLDQGEKTVELTEVGDYLIVPQNVWHTAKTQVKTTMLFITPGEGTQNKNV